MPLGNPRWRCRALVRVSSPVLLVEETGLALGLRLGNICHFTTVQSGPCKDSKTTTTHPPLGPPDSRDQIQLFILDLALQSL